ncbi:multidrug efflux SMR transporter [Paenibacillus alkaliterrae]|uniref:DMT family transporter n=1 Tax=Paenibacillus alkaliterrae TaxID=320909 RepID=UPI001F341289|nr:multidrug efflux SMR transporter [Paenibacillus alkaliterrae]MCF2938241.1 multidrug efflux SMR transporter [Paenibacillus alkaliterrae]
MSWLFVILAGLFEIAGVTGIAQLNRRPSVRTFLIMAGGFAISFWFLALAMNELAMGTAYAVWTGIGTVGSALIGILFYKESKSLMRIAFMMLVLGSVIGLKLIE